MSDWNDLERLWQSLPAKAAPAAEELRRQHRWRWASLALIVGDVVMTIVGLGAGIWLMSRGVSRGSSFAVLMGIVAVAIAAVAGALAWWARAIGQARMQDPVAQAVAVAVRRARIGVRLAVATQWAICLGLIFTALVTFGRAMGGSVDIGASNMAFMAVAITQVWMAVCLAGAIVYHHKRAADLARLEALAASLKD